MVGHYIPVYTTKYTVEVYSADSAFCRKVDGKIKIIYFENKQKNNITHNTSNG